MARGYKPSVPFAVPFKVLPQITTMIQGVSKRDFARPNDVREVMFCSFRTFGGTERDINGVYTLEDTATLDTWFDPAITADVRIYLLDTGATYEVIGTPENIDMRNQYLRLKVRRIGGAA